MKLNNISFLIKDYSYFWIFHIILRNFYKPQGNTNLIYWKEHM